MINKTDILKLRSIGLTYSEISNTLKCAKSTISHYLGKSRNSNKSNNYCKYCNEKIGHCQTFCDKLCNKKYLDRKRIENLLKSKVLTNFTIRRALSELNGSYCLICGLSTTWNSQSLTLHVDHIDGNSDNNNLINLRLVCPNCHSQLDTTKNHKKKETKRNNYLRKVKGYK